mmetsp:Transcript_8896/g.10997  ORF Transcript_8896/g.10997 Transcript_8896/m.10997 type:complete len:134 (-) Transcript_8896:55-456(-)
MLSASAPVVSFFARRSVEVCFPACTSKHVISKFFNQNRQTFQVQRNTFHGTQIAPEVQLFYTLSSGRPSVEMKKETPHYFEANVSESTAQPETEQNAIVGNAGVIPPTPMKTSYHFLYKPLHYFQNLVNLFRW